MTGGSLFAPRALRELGNAAEWIAERNPAAAEGLLQAAAAAARMTADRPGLARTRLEIAPERFRFLALRGYPYLLVFDGDRSPLVVVRVVHQMRDLPTLLADLDD